MLTCCASDLEPTKTSRVKKKGWFFRIITKHIAPLQKHTGFGINFKIRSFPSFITTSSSSIYHQVCKVMLRRSRHGWNHARSTIKASPSSINSCLSVSKLSGVCGDGGNINTPKPENPASDICTLQTTEPWTSYITLIARTAPVSEDPAPFCCEIRYKNYPPRYHLMHTPYATKPRRPTKRKNGGVPNVKCKICMKLSSDKAGYLRNKVLKVHLLSPFGTPKKTLPAPGHWKSKVISTNDTWRNFSRI